MKEQDIYKEIEQAEKEIDLAKQRLENLKKQLDKKVKLIDVMKVFYSNSTSKDQVNNVYVTSYGNINSIPSQDERSKITSFSNDGYSLKFGFSLIVKNSQDNSYYALLNSDHWLDANYDFKAEKEALLRQLNG